MTTPVFGVTGWKNSGKTTLVTRLVSAFAERGFNVSTVKHAHHAFDVDKPGTDSFRHREAGATEVMIVSGYRWALMHELRDDDEPPLETMLQNMSAADLIIIEGYKRERHPKIEVRRKDSGRDQALAPDDSTIVAVASDHDAETGGLPHFHIDDIEGMAAFIADYLGLPLPEPAATHV